MSVGHFIELSPNLLGEPVRRRYTKRIMGGEWHVHVTLTVNGTPVDDRFYPMDTDRGREAMALDCVSPDMVPAE